MSCKRTEGVLPDRCPLVDAQIGRRAQRVSDRKQRVPPAVRLSTMLRIAPPHRVEPWDRPMQDTVSSEEPALGVSLGRNVRFVAAPRLGLGVGQAGSKRRQRLEAMILKSVPPPSGTPIQVLLRVVEADDRHLGRYDVVGQLGYCVQHLEPSPGFCGGSLCSA